MRTLACLIAAVIAAPAFGQSAPYLAEVTADTVALRSGPGDQMPDTGFVARGARLVVDHEDGDWLAVQPPNGQVSWINHKFLAPVDGHAADVFPRNAVVVADSAAEVAHGRPGLPRPLDVRRTRVPDGTVVCVIGPKANSNGSLWYPIAPPDGDFRYVPRSVVRMVRGQPVQSFVVRSPDPPPVEAPDLPVASLPAPGDTTGSAGRRGDSWPSHPLWRQAEQAEREGDFDRAEQLYLRLAADMNKPGGDADLANLCYSRVHSVREKSRQGGRTASGARRDLPPSDAVSAEGKWAGPGRLREAGFRFDRQTTYALVNPQGRVICYGLPGRRVDLDRFLGTDVELYGRVEYPGDLRGAGIMTVTHVRPLAER